MFIGATEGILEAHVEEAVDSAAGDGGYARGGLERQSGGSGFQAAQESSPSRGGAITGSAAQPRLAGGVVGSASMGQVGGAVSSTGGSQQQPSFDRSTFLSLAAQPGGKSAALQYLLQSTSNALPLMKEKGGGGGPIMYVSLCESVRAAPELVPT